MKLSLQYLNDTNGKPTAVQIPISEWQKLMKSHLHLEKLMDVKSGLEQALKELESMRKGKLNKQTLSDFLNEI